MNEPLMHPTRVLPTEAEVAEVFDQHRRKSMGVASVTCECGEILHGDDNMTQFSADEAFRLHMASHILALFAAQPTVAQVKAEALQGATYDTAFVRRCATDETYNGELLSARDFDRWLAQVKAEAWDEGYGTGVHDERTAAEVDWPEYREPGRVNPYRTERRDHA